MYSLRRLPLVLSQPSLFFFLRPHLNAESQTTVNELRRQQLSLPPALTLPELCTEIFSFFPTCQWRESKGGSIGSKGVMTNSLADNVIRKKDQGLLIEWDKGAKVTPCVAGVFSTPLCGSNPPNMSRSLL